MLSATLLARTAACVLTVSVPAWAQTVPARTNTPSVSRTAAGARTDARDAAREAHDVTRLGGTTRFYRGSLASAAGLRRMSTDPAMSASMRGLLADAGAANVSDALLTALGRVEENYVGVACMEARPEPGTVVECDVRPGESLEWMVFRPGGGAPAVVRNVRWAGRQPFRAYLVRVADRETSYTFLVPKDCGNLSLLSTQALAQPASVADVVAAPPPPPPPPPAAAVVAPPPEPAPPIAPPAEVRAETEQAPALPAPRPVRFFADGLFGKERRVRTLDDDALLGTGDGEFAQCSPLVGLKAGIARRFDNNWELAGAAGVALVVVRDDNKVREHALFVEAEANRWIGRGFVGGGVGLWDLTRSDTITPTAMVHFGLPVADHLRFPIYFLLEGRLFLDNVDDIDNNYQFWGGLRIRF